MQNTSLKNWMSCLADGVLLKDVVMPGSHNAGAWGMSPIASCQEADLIEQFDCGVRYFDLRTKVKNGKSYVSHGITKGLPFELLAAQLGQIIDQNPTEFLILDLREYRLRDCRSHLTDMMSKMPAGEVADMDDIISEHLSPKDFALTDFDPATTTMGDIRTQGKRYLLLNAHKSYAYSVDTAFQMPWDKKIHGLPPEEFICQATILAENTECGGLFGLQAQLTPNLFTKLGLKTPQKLDQMVKPYFSDWMQSIADNPKLLDKLGIIAADYMTDGAYKSQAIISLNLKKGNIKNNQEEAFKALL